MILIVHYTIIIHSRQFQFEWPRFLISTENEEKLQNIVLRLRLERTCGLGLFQALKNHKMSI